MSDYAHNVLVTETLALVELVRSVADTGVSFREMERRANAAGYQISHSHLADHAKGVVRKPPRADDIAAIAAALGKSEETVRRAVMVQYLGAKVEEVGTGLTAAIPPDLSDDEREELERMIEAWLIARGRRSAR